MGEEGTGKEERNYKGHEKPLWGGGYVYYLDWGNVVMNVYMSKL